MSTLIRRAESAYADAAHLGFRDVGAARTVLLGRPMLKPKKLALRPETIRVLTDANLQQAAGGWIRPPITVSCPQPSNSGCCPKDTTTP